VPELVDVPGAMLWTVSQGDGVPLVLCHGGPALSDNLGPVAAMVDDLARVHRFDQRGGGRSRSDGPFDVDAMVADLEALRRHWGHERWIVGGHSWGASLPLLFALAHPDRTLGVVYLAGTGLRWGWQEDSRRVRLARLTDAERAELAALETRLGDRDPAVTERFLRLIWTTDFADRARADAVLAERPLYAFPRDERIFRAVSESQRARLDAGLDDDVRRLDVPVLVVHGAHDTDPRRARQVAELAPRGRYVEIAGAGHSPWLEQPDALRAALRDFVAQVG
jgi:proline iminopeptidase